MPYTLKHLPERYPRPKPLKFSRWLVALVVMLSVSIIIMRIFGRYVENLYFWRLALGFPVALWSVLLSSRLLVWSLQDSKANAFDKQRLLCKTTTALLFHRSAGMVMKAPE